jgi:hypothetical protein
MTACQCGVDHAGARKTAAVCAGLPAGFNEFLRFFLAMQMALIGFTRMRSQFDCQI